MGQNWRKDQGQGKDEIARHLQPLIEELCRAKVFCETGLISSTVPPDFGLLPIVKSIYALVAFGLISLAAAQTPSPVEASLCGPFPKNYKEVVWNWLQGVLLDADSAKIEWQGEPKPADLGKNGDHLYGWLVEFQVNSRNRFGSYTGKQSHGALIRDNQVVKGVGFAY